MAATTETPTSTQRGGATQGNQREGSTGQGNSGQRNLTRSSEQGGLAGSRAAQPYFPSPSEFFSNPFAAMRRMHEDMDRMLAQALTGSRPEGGRSEGGLSMWSPAIETKQRGNDLIVCAELPGLKPEEVQVEVTDDALVIQGERRQEQTSDEGGVHHTERRYGRFYRAIPLPEGVNADQAKAEFHDGVLEVTVPIPEQQSRRRQIPISGASTPTSRGSTQGGNGSAQRS